MSIALVALGIIAVGLGIGLVLLDRKLRHVRAQYVGIDNAEAEIARLKADAANAIARERSDAAVAAGTGRIQAGAATVVVVVVVVEADKAAEDKTPELIISY